MNEVPRNDECPSLLEIFDVCCQGARDFSDQEKIRKYIYIYLLNAADYNYLASFGQYEKIKFVTPVYDLGLNIEQFKEDFKKFYENQLRASGRLGRKYYDQIIRQQNRCLYCMMINKRYLELDHFLPKSQYAIFSIFPKNLIPCCTFCNKEKRTNILPLHPYYDNIHQHRWLFARIEDHEYGEYGSSFVFYVDPPKEIEQELGNKIKKYFEILKLGKAYAAVSANELGEAKELINLKLTSDELKRELKERFKNYDNDVINHWRRAVCECIEQANSKELTKLLKPIE